jgi:hypothetical protein
MFLRFSWGMLTNVCEIFSIFHHFSYSFVLTKALFNIIIIPTIREFSALMYDLFIYLFTAVRLGDQCFYRQTCSFTDQHATCIQVNHNAICQCKPGYHTVALQRPTKKVFCSAGTDFVHLLLWINYMTRNFVFYIV